MNNAGCATTAPVEFLPLEVFRQQIEVNLTGGPCHVMRQRAAVSGVSGRRLAAGDAAAWQGCFPDAVVWHLHDEADSTVLIVSVLRNHEPSWTRAALQA